MAEDVIIKAKIEVDGEQAAKSMDKVKSSVASTSKEASSSSGIFSKLKETISSVSPATEGASKGVGIFNTSLNVLKANPIIAVIAGLVGLVIALFQPFKKMEAVSDSLGKAWGTLSGVFSKFINGVLTPLIDGFTFLVDLFTNSVVSILDTLGVTSSKTAERFGEITEALDDLEDSEKNAAIAMAESNRKLQEAREIAGDANVPIKERIEALKLAGKIEKEELDKVVKLNQMKASLTMESIAMELGAKDELIAKIKEGTLESLKAARVELAAMKNVDKEKLYAIDQQIIAAENAAAQSAKIGKKTQAGIDNLNKEQAAKEKELADKRKAARDKELAEYNKYLQLKNKLTNDANLSAITDGTELAKQKILNSEKDKLKEVESLVTSETNKAQLRAMIHKSSLEEIAKIDKEKYLKDKEKSDKDFEEWKIARLGRAAKEDLENKKIEDDRLNAQIKKAVEDKKIKDEIELRTLNPQEKYDEELIALEEKYKRELEIVGTNEYLKARLQQEYEEANTALKTDHLNKQLDEVENIGNSIVSIIGQQTAVGKGIGVANALINTYQGATDALRAKSTLPSPFDVIAKIANVSAVLASGFKSVKAITSVQIPGASGGGGGVPSMPAPISPQQMSTQLNQSSINAVGNAAQGGTNRAFVLSSDIKNDADRTVRINRAARLG